MPDETARSGRLAAPPRGRLVFGLLLYAKERFPAPLVFTYSLLFALSVVTFFGRGGQPRRLAGLFAPTLLVALTVSLFFMRLRLFDEIKDYAYDCLHHPDRPVQQGVVGIGTVKVLAALVLLAEISLQAFAPVRALPAYLIVLLYSLLMFKEFFADEFLSRRLALKLFLHQLIFAALTLYAAGVVTAGGYRPRLSLDLLLFPVMLVPTLLFELGRKIEHRRDSTGAITDDTYAYRWGAPRTFCVMMLAALAQALCLLALSPARRLIVLAYLSAVALLVVSFLGRPALVVRTAKAWSVVLAMLGQTLFLALNLL